MRLCGGTGKAPKVNTSDLSHNWTVMSEGEDGARNEDEDVEVDELDNEVFGKRSDEVLLE